MPPPARVAWAVELLDVQPEDRILEIGSGPGLAVGLVCARLGTGSIVAADRSATAVARGTARNAEWVASGRARFLQAPAGALGLPAASVDKAFAVNVNVFWTTDATEELAELRSVVRPGGVVRLVYEEPPGGRRAVHPAVVAGLERHGFAAAVDHHPGERLTCITGR